MCGIFCSFDKSKVAELASLNQSRGGHSFSIMADTGELHKNFGAFDIDMMPQGKFWVCHVQAPTTEARGIDSVHPAETSSARLWHNGIIKDFDVKRLQEKHGTSQQWDTMLLLNELLEASDNLNEINGSFACILHIDDQLYAFRNEISPLFYDDTISISSVKFPGSISLPPNKIFWLDLENRKLVDTDIGFTTKENPYFMG